jgi:hypothetical protein
MEGTEEPAKRGRGRPKGSGNKTTTKPNPALKVTNGNAEGVRGHGRPKGSGIKETTTMASTGEKKKGRPAKAKTSAKSETGEKKKRGRPCGTKREMEDTIEDAGEAPQSSKKAKIVEGGKEDEEISKIYRSASTENEV